MVVKFHYYFSGMKKNIKEYDERCLKCEVFKFIQMKFLGLLQQLDVPNLKFKSFSMDFIIGLPKIQNNFDYIMMVMDRLTKIAYFIPTVITIIIYGVIELFMSEIFRHHDIPCEIMNDRDYKFMSEFWTTLFKL